MNARMRRIASDWEQIKKDFDGHKYITVESVGAEPPEKYKVTYFVNGIYLLPDGRIETLNKHIVEITLHADYPRYKPVCKILTPIWHPNFRDGQICIGDIWGAGESISDIIINIGDMIQYKSWNSFSPLCADAAKWAIEHKHIFPVGTIDLYKADDADVNKDFEIDLFQDENEDNVISNENVSYKDGAAIINDAYAEDDDIVPISNGIRKSDDLEFEQMDINEDINDFEITAQELEGVEFIPTAQRMQTLSAGSLVKGKRINFKTIFTKGILYGLVGGFAGFIISELLREPTEAQSILRMMGYTRQSLMYSDISEYQAYSLIATAMRFSSGIFSGILASFIGAFMGLGEGIYYGSKEKSIKYGAIGFAVALVIGFISGFIAQIIYSALMNVNPPFIVSALFRGFGWAIMGTGIGFAIGIIKPELKRILYCTIGGCSGGFIGGFLFDYIYEIFTFSETDTGTLSRLIGIVIMGVLIGLGIGLLEQFAKSAWLKVIRGEFEGKEYLVFNGTTSIGNNGKNTIVLFKDKLVAQNHCDIILEGNKYIIVDKGSPTGTIVNGMKITRHILRQGDAISIGNSVLVFNTK